MNIITKYQYTMFIVLSSMTKQ